MKNYILLIIIALIFSSVALVSAQENKITLTTYYPAPLGSYDNMKLVPRTAEPFPCTSEKYGSMYVLKVSETKHELKVCQASDTGPSWSTVSGGNITNVTNLYVGTDTPDDNTDDKFVGKGQHGKGKIMDNSGGGTKLIWYPRKSAFRVGHCNDTRWDDSQIGDYSVAMGYDPLASAEATVAIGYSPQAMASHAVALGENTTASGIASTAFGASTKASGSYSSAMGYGIEAKGNYSFAVALDGLQSGKQVTQANTMSIMGGRVGINTKVPEFRLSLDSNDADIATPDGGIIAKGTYGSGNSLTTSGAGTRLIWYPKKAAFRAGGVTGAAWDEANIGYYSTAFGSNNTANGDTSMATGLGNTASGTNSFAAGHQNNATGTDAIAMGYGNTAGPYSTAIGYSSIANADYALALGQLTQATGIASVAIGTKTKATGHTAVAIGYGIEAAGYGSIAIGMDSGMHPTVTQDATMAIMGGNVGINTVTPPSRLAVMGLGSGSSGYLMRYDPTDGRFFYDTSTKDHKTDIKVLEDDWYKIFKIIPKTFIDTTTQKPGLGIIAEEMDEIGLKNLVIYKDGKPHAFMYDKLPLYILMVVKDQQKTIDQLKAIVCQDHPEAELCK
jgi:hypothetical protein